MNPLSTFYYSPLGPLLLTSDGDALTGLWFDHKNHDAVSQAIPLDDTSLPAFRQTQKWLDEYFRGGIPDFMPPIRLNGSPFRLTVWNRLKQIPYGETVTYGEIAREIAKERGLQKMSAQAVGGAVGHNPISILIPCHRVIGADGQLVGYAGGLDLKKKLLQLEKERR